ncbi:MAG: secondary thiamine-phosphate synthase enzyme YjbQ [Candidatus Omnitrophica bacterium]|jgi:secondary thiamine-phosphate synthase enzyme|nr:secondary thiamine-phosphate synthase enzyme YjbQ [Candidatus Omnitrophota bacterium]
MDSIAINTKKRNEFIDITSQVEKIVKDSKIKDGLCVVFCPHTTAALTINENADPSVKKDIISHLEELVPVGKGFSHSEGNSDAHIKASLLGSSLNVIIEEGNLALGPWQGIYFCEFDGPRNRNIYVKLIGEK